MNKNAEPIKYLINLCESKKLVTQFDTSNAKDELKQLYAEKEQLQKQINDFESIFSKPIGWGRINDRNDIYDLSTCCNQYLNQDTVVPLYTDKETFTKWINSRK
jgi:hypothetical protein